mmetsp:Transcript_24815/g.53543  ORF Transcript_24815/g.53543 Transcript_24815/m.53543 type:complete len:266 (+) Transcript_24815:742-1539(+)
MEFSPVTYGERILVLSLCFWSLVIAATYTANLASAMISRNQSIYPATSLVEARYKGVSVCVARGFAVGSKLKQAYPHVKLVESEGLFSMYEDLRNNKCGLLADTVSRFEINKLNQSLNPDCSLEWVGRAVDISSAGPANVVDAGIYCTSLVGHVFEYYLKDMQRDGFIDNAFEHYTKSVTTHRCPEQEGTSLDAEESFRLTMVDMGGIFLCHGMACLVGLLVSLLQRCGTNQKKKNIRVGSAQKVDEENCGNVIMTSRQLGCGGY